MSRHGAGEGYLALKIWLGGMIFYILFAIVWLQYLPTYAAFNTLARSEAITPVQSFLLISFFYWLGIMILGWMAWK